MTPEPRSAAPSRKRLLPVIAMIATFIMTFSLAAPASATPQTALTTTRTVVVPPVRTADLSNFRPGNIISDEVFFASNSMSQAQIDSFFKSKVSSCRSGYTCLKDYRQSTPNRPADSYCKGYSGAANESAAAIIYKSAVSCGINPQVLIVMLEKEQSLVTHTWPSSWRYDMALGQGCPDTAPCDPSFSGFFYQIYGAARQMKIYTEGKWFTWYAPGKTWNIRYNPNESCGSSPVYVENAATAALYYYTPYQPNPAALRAGYGIGDNCSAYGNRNFYNLFNDWFGSTQSTANYGPLIQAQGDSKVYLVSDGRKYHVTDYYDLLAFMSRLGGVQSVTASYRDKLPNGGSTSRYVHDPRTGTLYLLEVDGTKHRFPTPALVTAFGYDFESYTNLEAGLIDAFSNGGEIGNVFRSESSPDVYRIDGSTKRYIPTVAALQAAYGSARSTSPRWTQPPRTRNPRGRCSSSLECCCASAVRPDKCSWRPTARTL